MFSFGANDCVLDPVSRSRRVDLPSSLEKAEAILGEAQNWLPTMMVGPGIIADDAEATERICDLSDRYAKLCKRMAVPYLELSASLLASEVWRREAVSGDGAHPNQHGYELIAEIVEDWRPWQVWTGKALPWEHDDAFKTTP